MSSIKEVEIANSIDHLWTSQSLEGRRDPRWDKALLTASEIPTENVLEGLNKLKLHDSVQLQTVLALYEQEIVRNREGKTTH